MSHSSLRSISLCSVFHFLISSFIFASSPAGGDLEEGRALPHRFLDVTKAPFFADPNGKKDATEAIQKAVNEARNRRQVCFFPVGTYLVSDTISGEQRVKKLATPRHTDGKTQSYWDVSERITMRGSTKGGQRPVLKLSPEAKGFDDPANPKKLIWIWAQTRDDAPGKSEPEWGKEQPNISFGHSFIGIDIDIRGHAGAIGIRHTGSQGATLQDCTIYAEGAFAGMNNCPGQAGGTYNVKVIGGDYAFVVERRSRFPLLVACSFLNQKKAAIRYIGGPPQVPTLLVGCLIESNSGRVIDLTTERSYAGISFIDCVIRMQGGTFVATRQSENIYLENSYLHGAKFIAGETKSPSPEKWTKIERYSSHAGRSANLINGKEGKGEIISWKALERKPDIDAIQRRHWHRQSSFEDADVVDVRAFGAKGDGKTNDFAAFQEAVLKHDKVFVPPGYYKVKGELKLRANTELFGASRYGTSIGAVDEKRRRGKGTPSFSITSVDDRNAAPSISFLAVRGNINWRSGKGFYMHNSGGLKLSGNAGGKIHAPMAIGGQLVIENIINPLEFYTLNVERVGNNPQSLIRNSKHVRIFYFKVEAGTLNRADAKDGNTPCGIVDSEDIRIYCMYGNVKKTCRPSNAKHRPFQPDCCFTTKGFYSRIFSAHYGEW